MIMELITVVVIGFNSRSREGATEFPVKKDSESEFQFTLP